MDTSDINSLLKAIGIIVLSTWGILSLIGIWLFVKK